MVDPDIVKQDADRLQANYARAIGDLDATWRALRLESDPGKRDRLEQRAETLTQAARELAGRQEIAVKALQTLAGENG